MRWPLLEAMVYTRIVITHDPTLARRASRVVEIRDGRITADHPAVA